MSDAGSEHQGVERLERAATWLSLLCAVHCLAVPAMAAGLPLAGASVSGFLHHPALEFALSLLVVAGALFNAFWGYRRHRDLRLVVGALVGLAIYGVGHLLDPWFGTALSVGGALMLAAAALLGARLSHAHGEHCAH